MKLMPNREIKELSRVIEREMTNETQPRWVRLKARRAAEQGIRSALSRLEKRQENSASTPPNAS